MEVNADFSQRSVIDTEKLEWQDSPMKGVRRRVLDRVGAEVARATTIVSYEPNSHFSAHVHTGGEEFIVLDGVFQDEHGDFPVGTYVRNPPQSSHTPGSEPGCVIFVKLWQFDLNDRTPVRIDMNNTPLAQDQYRSDVQSAVLFKDAHETVQLEQWQPNSDITINTEGGAELLVLDGSFTEGTDTLVRHAWLRLPVGYTFSARTGDHGARLWIKTGHLTLAEEQKQRMLRQ
jgi:anti-sigma factor ChrR (cupin superfamily)